MNVTDIASGLHAIWDDNPSAETREHLVEKIDAFHHRTFPSEFKRFTLFLQDNTASLKGGVSGAIYCDWLRIDGLWVDDVLRRRGIGTRLMTRAENHAIELRCHSAWLTTFQARGFYEAVGYEVFGTLDNFPAAQQQHFMKKRLIP
jgi:N-acetylglutamate synthase-like GNAT family acetyltransferase